jgi:hypothetical protein
MRIRMIACTIVLMSIALLSSGCGSTRLAKEGVYKGDDVLFRAEQATVQGAKVLHSFVKWERTHRAILPVEVSRAADHVRDNAERWVDSAIALRDAYVGNPNEENRNRLQQALTLLEAALAEATRYMTDPNLTAPSVPQSSPASPPR